VALISPPLEPEVSVLSHDGKQFAFIEVRASESAPHLVGNQWYERIGTTTRIGSPATLRAYSVSSGANPEVPLATQRLIAQVQELSDMVRDSTKWSPKLRDMVIGGVIGAIISLLVSFLL
jgi:predicted HTH transcriptional regulator